MDIHLFIEFWVWCLQFDKNFVVIVCLSLHNLLSSTEINGLRCQEICIEHYFGYLPAFVHLNKFFTNAVDAASAVCFLLLGGCIALPLTRFWSWRIDSWELINFKALRMHSWRIVTWVHIFGGLSFSSINFSWQGFNHIMVLVLFL